MASELSKIACREIVTSYEIGDLVYGLTGEAAKEADREVHDLLHKVRNLDRDLYFKLEAAINAAEVVYIHSAFSIGFEVGRDPAILIFEPDSED